MDTLWQDVRFGVRMLLRSPGFTAIALLTLALGIGANTAIFSVINAVLLQPLPYREPDRIAMVWSDNRMLGLKEDITSYPNYRDWRDSNRTFAAMAAFRPQQVNLTGTGDPERLQTALVTASFFDVMGVTPFIGRTFSRAEETPGKDRVVLISEGLWRRRFGGAADIAGSKLLLNGEAYDVIGVLPAALDFPTRCDAWAPLAPQERQREARGSFWLPVVGRLRPGVTVAEAQADMTLVTANLERQYPNANAGFGAHVVSLHRQLVGRSQEVLLVLLAAVAFLLLIACVNVANLMLARASIRRREMALRLALGAGRWRLVRQLLTENLILAGLGGGLGLVLAVWTKDLVALLHDGSASPLRPSQYALRIGAVPLDAGVLAFTACTALGAGLLFGVIPALQTSALRLVDVIKEGSRTSGQGARRWTRDVLVVTEVVLAVLLLAGAGLMIKSFRHLSEVDPGMRTSGVITASVAMPAYRYRERAEVRAHAERILERIRRLPGVAGAGGTSTVFLSPTPNSTVFQIEGQPPPKPGQGIEVPFDSVTSGYFETLQVPLRRGRLFGAADEDAAAAPTALVNETMARTFWSGGDALGKRVNFGGPPGPDDPWITIVGIVADTKRNGIGRPVRPEIYFPYGQSATRTLALVIRTSGPPMAVVPAVRQAVLALDPEQPLFAVTTLDAYLAESIAQPRRSSALIGALAALALLLASVGIYGVLSYAVLQRTRELGTRIALGAAPGQVFRLVVGHGLALTGVGIAVGLAAALLLTRFLQTLLYEVTPTDPSTFAGLAAVMLAVAALACYIPARRAMRVDPLVALREE